YQLKALALAFGEPVFCAVVDPGVGTARRGLAVEVGDAICVAPDNGLISYLWEETVPMLRRVVSIDVPGDISATFHGRDVFAPAAARLAGGASLTSLGDPIDDPVILDTAFATADALGLHGRVAVVDHFGNAITTIREEDLGATTLTGASWGGGSTAHVVATYDEIPDGELAVLVGSAGHVEIAARGAAAASLNGPAVGDAVTVTFG
ncbi:MAG: SAM-dependent chlorinase/fluorinase, partial [Candidatus Dormibacteraeota bacterium]|nr:SAM-dependent chlorinase/fluorinase [Candidatus Dormibacteraeota bacterium]